MRVCIIDTETTGLDDSAELIEVAFASYNFTETDFSMIECASFLIPKDENPAQEVNGISPELSKMAMLVPFSISHAINCCDCFIAHNAEFDKKFFRKTFNTGCYNPWVCTVADYELDCGKSRKLNHVCADNGIFFTAGKHRAMIDVLMLAELVGKLGYVRFLKAFERSKMPEYKLISLAPFADKDAVKAAGFRWSPDTKQWTKNVKTRDVGALVKGLPFECVCEALI
jgi:DNA polymerase III subunit epsilon